MALKQLLVVALVALAALGLGSAADAGQPEPAERLSVGGEAPAFSLRTMNAERCGMAGLSTRHHVGPGAVTPKKALVLSFAASYCAPCKKELPLLGELARGFAKDDVLIAIVVVDRDDEGQEAMRRFVVEELALELPALADRFGLVARRYGATELPCLAVVGAAGELRWIRHGFHEDTLSELRRVIGEVVPVPPVSNPDVRTGAGGR